MESKRNGIDNWPEPRGSVNCPPESKLAEWILNPESSEAQAHLAECAACRAVIDTCQSSMRSPSSLDDFMRDVRLRALEQAERRSSKWTVFVNYITASRVQTVSALAAVAALALIATSGAWRHLSLLRPRPQVQTIVMDADANGESYREALTELNQSYSAIASGKGSQENAASQIERLNQALDKVDIERLQPEQKQQLETLQAQYQALVFDRHEANSVSSPVGAKAQNLQSNFFSTYARYLANDGEKLTVSPEVSLKFSETKMSVIGHPDVPDAKKTAANRAVRDLRNQVPDMFFEYKTGPLASAAQSSSETH
jgi:hypothetical protein